MKLVEGEMTVGKLVGLLTLGGMFVSSLGMFGTAIWKISDLSRDVQANTQRSTASLSSSSFSSYVKREQERNQDFRYNQRLIASKVDTLSDRLSKLEGRAGLADDTEENAGLAFSDLPRASLLALLDFEAPVPRPPRTQTPLLRELRWISTSNELLPQWLLLLRPPSVRRSPAPRSTSSPKVGLARKKAPLTKSLRRQFRPPLQKG